MGGDERPEIPQWGISAKNARPVAGPGWQALPGGACRALTPGKKVRSEKGLKPPSGIFCQAENTSKSRATRPVGLVPPQMPLTPKNRVRATF